MKMSTPFRLTVKTGNNSVSIAKSGNDVEERVRPGLTQFINLLK